MKSPVIFVLMVPGAGLEPARLATGDFKSPVSTNFTNRACEVYYTSCSPSYTTYSHVLYSWSERL